MDSTDRDQLEAQLSAYLDGELSPEQVTEMERQLASDPDAQTTLDSLRRTVQLIRTLPRHPAPAGVLDDLTAAAERDQLLEPSSESASSRATRWEDVRSLLATAAVVMITVGTGLWFSRRSSDTNNLADPRTRLVETNTANPIENPATLMPSGESLKERPSKIRARSNREEDGATARNAEGAARIQEAVAKDTRVTPFAIALDSKHALAEGDTQITLSNASESDSFTPGPPVSDVGSQVVETFLAPAPAPARSRASVRNRNSARVDSSSTTLADSVASDDTVPPSMGETPREHVLPLSFICAGIADRQACELGLRNYIQARAQRATAQIDSGTGSSRGQAEPAAPQGLATKTSRDRYRHADEDHPNAPELRQASLPLLKQVGAAWTDGYRVRVPASELLDLIDQVSAAAQSEVIPELEIGPFRAIGRGRIEQLVNESNYSIAPEAPGDSEAKNETVGPAAESSAAWARVAGDIDDGADPVVRVDTGVPHGADSGSTASDRTTRLGRRRASRAKVLPFQQPETPPAGDAGLARSLAPDAGLEADSSSPGEGEPRQVKPTPARDPWITFVIRFLDGGESNTPVRAPLESLPDELGGRVNGEPSVSTREEAQQDKTAAQPPVPATSNDNANSSP